MQNLLIGWLVNHRQLFEGMAIGYATAHIPAMTSYAFFTLMRIPIIKNWIIANPEKARTMVDAIAKELDKDIDQEANAPKT